MVRGPHKTVMEMVVGPEVKKQGSPPAPLRTRESPVVELENEVAMSVEKVDAPGDPQLPEQK